VFEAAVEVSSRCRSVEAAIEVFEAAVEVSSRCRSVKAVEVSRLSRCQGCRGVKAAVDVKDTILEINTTVKVKIVRFFVEGWLCVVDMVVRLLCVCRLACACADLLVVPAPPVCLCPLLCGVCHSCVVPALPCAMVSDCP
jgi:hypothetical protein